MAEQLAKVGDVIRPGDAIADNVTEVSDHDGDGWTRIGDRWAWLRYSTGTPKDDADPESAEWLVDNCAPLTVTAVREPEPGVSVSGLCEVGSDKVTCIVMDADHRRIYHGGRPVPPYASTEALLHPAEPQPESDLLALVRQYGDAREAFREALHVEGFLGDVHKRAEAGGALFARIEAEVQRLRTAVAHQPIQARDDRGWRWWIHGCGQAFVAEIGAPRACCDSGPWRPLLVGGDPASEHADDTLDQARADYEAARAKLLKTTVERDDARRARDFLAEQVVSPSREALDAVGVDGGLKLADRILTLANQRDEARAQAERLKDELAAEEEGRRQDWVDRLAPPDPLVLTLPQVPRVFEIPKAPEGVVRVRDSQDEVWALDSDDGLWHCDERGWSPLPWHLLLADHGDLTEMAPPREPRTKIGETIKRGADKVPADVKQFVDRRYLRVWSQHPADPAGTWGSAQPSVAWGERHLLDECAPLVVTGVFDEPGGQQ